MPDKPNETGGSQDESVSIDPDSITIEVADDVELSDRVAAALQELAEAIEEEQGEVVGYSFGSDPMGNPLKITTEIKIDGKPQPITVDTGMVMIGMIRIGMMMDKFM